MAITIKEIHVVTTVSKDLRRQEVDPEIIRKLKEEMLAELKRYEKKKQNRKYER